LIHSVRYAVKVDRLLVAALQLRFTVVFGHFESVLFDLIGELFPDIGSIEAAVARFPVFFECVSAVYNLKRDGDGDVAALYAVILSFSPAFAALVNSIPTAIIGGVSFILYGMISAIGVRNVVENRVDFTNSRNLIIAAVILVCGLGFTGGLTFTIGSATITLTSLAIAAIAGIVLNAILPGNDYQFGSDVTDGRSGDFGRY